MSDIATGHLLNIFKHPKRPTISSLDVVQSPAMARHLSLRVAFLIGNIVLVLV